MAEVHRTVLPGFNHELVDFKQLNVPSWKEITTGGTFNSGPDSKDGCSPLPRSILPFFVSVILRCRARCEVAEVCLKDSRDLTDENVDQVAREMINSPAVYSTVTMGTYAMPDKAAEIAENDSYRGRIDAKMSIFTGSMLPLSRYVKSDAGFNYGMSLAGFTALKKGDIAVCLSGNLIEAEHVSKDLRKGRFVPRNPKYSFWKNSPDIDVISTGGTIDSCLDGMGKEKVLELTCLPDFFEELNLDRIVRVSPIKKLKQSYELLSTDVDEIVELIHCAPSGNVIVTMGVVAMERMREVLSEKLRLRDGKTVILVGSRFFLSTSDSASTDAATNLGFGVGSFGNPHLEREQVHIALGGILLQKGDQVDHHFTKEELPTLRRLMRKIKF